ncbi:hypothetical protein D9M69_392940 [compost metagenome]
MAGRRSATAAKASANSRAGASSNWQWDGTLTARRFAAAAPRARARSATAAMAASLPAITNWLSALILARNTGPSASASRRSTVAWSRPMIAVMPKPCG